MDPNRKMDGNNDPKRGGDDKNPKNNLWVKLLIAEPSLVQVIPLVTIPESAEKIEKVTKQYRRGLITEDERFKDVIYLSLEDLKLIDLKYNLTHHYL